LSKEEILEGYEEHFGIPINEEEVDKMMKNVDIDGNGVIEYTEFVMATMNEKNMVSQDKLQAAFKMFDKDNSGTISPDEIREVLGFDSTISSKALDDIIREVDENGDGVIQYDEFVHMMKKLAINDP
jgi:calcium-dependent protein kinase